MKRDLTLSLLSLALTATAAAGAEVAQSAEGSAGWALVAIGEEARIESADGRMLPLTMPAGAHLGEIAELDGGWVAAGDVYQNGRNELLLLVAGPDGVRMLPEPGARERSHRGDAEPLVSEGRLAGVAWIEGYLPEETTIRATAWDGDAWSQPTIVSTPGPGGQVALEGTVLSDGSWLLVWTASDGRDDETMWALGTRDGWTTPRRLHEDNGVPDVMPAVARVAGGAVAAWSRYDGYDYRLRLAGFRGGAWQEIPLESGKGAHDAGFVRLEGRLTLLFNSVVPDAWSLLELAEDGRVRRRGEAPGGTFDRPLLRGGGPDGEILASWPGARSEPARRTEAVSWSETP